MKMTALIQTKLLTLSAIACLKICLALDNGVALTPPMGWMSAPTPGCVTDCEKNPDTCISEKVLMNVADLLVNEGYKNVGYDYLIIDDCWQATERTAEGRLQADTRRFPRGMEYLASYVHSKGLKLGLFEHYLTQTAGGYPGLQGHMKEDADTFAYWGIDYVKVDGYVDEFDNLKNTTTVFGNLLNQTGRPMVYACGWPLYLEQYGLEVDYSSVGEFCNTWRNYRNINDDYTLVEEIIDRFAFRQDSWQPYAGPGHWNDPDVLIIGNINLSFEQSKIQMAIWAILASPLIMSNDLRHVQSKFKAILQNQKIIKVNQDVLGIQGRRILQEDGIEIWTKPVTPIINGNKSFAIAFINRNNTVKLYTISMAKLGLEDPNGYEILDLYSSSLENPSTSIAYPNWKIKVAFVSQGVVFLKTTAFQSNRKDNPSPNDITKYINNAIDKEILYNESSETTKNDFTAMPNFENHEQQFYYLISNVSYFGIILNNVKIKGLQNFQKIQGEITELKMENIEINSILDSRLIYKTSIELNFKIDLISISVYKMKKKAVKFTNCSLLQNPTSPELTDHQLDMITKAIKFGIETFIMPSMQSIPTPYDMTKYLKDVIKAILHKRTSENSPSSISMLPNHVKHEQPFYYIPNATNYDVTLNDIKIEKLWNFESFINHTLLITNVEITLRANFGSKFKTSTSSMFKIDRLSISIDPPSGEIFVKAGNYSLVQKENLNLIENYSGLLMKTIELAICQSIQPSTMNKNSNSCKIIEQTSMVREDTKTSQLLSLLLSKTLQKWDGESIRNLYKGPIPFTTYTTNLTRIKIPQFNNVISFYDIVVEYITSVLYPSKIQCTFSKHLKLFYDINALPMGKFSLRRDNISTEGTFFASTDSVRISIMPTTRSELNDNYVLNIETDTIIKVDLYKTRYAYNRDEEHQVKKKIEEMLLSVFKEHVIHYAKPLFNASLHFCTRPKEDIEYYIPAELMETGNIFTSTLTMMFNFDLKFYNLQMANVRCNFYDDDDVIESIISFQFENLNGTMNVHSDEKFTKYEKWNFAVNNSAIIQINTRSGEVQLNATDFQLMNTTSNLKLDDADLRQIANKFEYIVSRSITQSLQNLYREKVVWIEIPVL